MSQVSFTEVCTDGLDLHAELETAQGSSVWNLAQDQATKDACEGELTEALESADMLNGEYEAIREIFERFSCFITP